MADLLPDSISDERFRQLESVAAARFASIDTTKLLVYVIDHAEPTALPALAWQLGAGGPAWQLADTVTKRRELLKRVVARRRRRGTPWAVKDALDALGFAAHIEERAVTRYDGSIRYDGLFRHHHHWAVFWVVLSTAAAGAAEDLVAVIEEWARKSSELGAIYFVHGVPDAGFRANAVAVYWPGEGLVGEPGEPLAPSAFDFSDPNNSGLAALL